MITTMDVCVKVECDVEVDSASTEYDDEQYEHAVSDIKLEDLWETNYQTCYPSDFPITSPELSDSCQPNQGKRTRYKRKSRAALVSSDPLCTTPLSAHTVAALSNARSFDEKIVILVEEYRNLYDATDITYKDQLHREITWEKIASRLNRSAFHCKKRWKSLREAYRKAMRERITRSPSAKKMRPWRLEAQMAFMKPFMSFENISKHHQGSPPPPPSPSTTSKFQKLPSGPPAPESTVPASTAPSPSKAVTVSVPPTTSSEDQKNSSTLPTSPSEEFQKETGPIEPGSETDDIAKYFNGLEAFFRSLPGNKQTKFKLQMSRLFYNAENEENS